MCRYHYLRWGHSRRQGWALWRRCCPGGGGLSILAILLIFTLLGVFSDPIVASGIRACVQELIVCVGASKCLCCTRDLAGSHWYDRAVFGRFLVCMRVRGAPGTLGVSQNHAPRAKSPAGQKLIGAKTHAGADLGGGSSDTDWRRVVAVVLRFSAGCRGYSEPASCGPITKIRLRGNPQENQLRWVIRARWVDEAIDATHKNTEKLWRKQRRHHMLQVVGDTRRGQSVRLCSPDGVSRYVPYVNTGGDSGRELHP